MPPVYAICGARIFTGTGPAIRSGTVVLRHGLIAAVSAATEVPLDAVFIDGTGLTVYPGLIDLGNTQLAAERTEQPPDDLKTLAELERWKHRQYCKPHACAADLVKASDPNLTKWAAAGITSVLAVPCGEVIAGQSTLIDTSVADPQPALGNIVGFAPQRRSIRSPVALHVFLPARQRAGGIAYPASLMGVVAFVRQAFLDAQHDALERRAHQHSMDRHPSDPGLEAMQAAVAGRMPVAFEANAPWEILRALRLARELRLDPIVTGAREAGEVTLDLAAGSAKVIYSLDYPTRPAALAPGADEPLRSLRVRARAPGVPAALAQAGVPFAFASAGLSDPKQFLANAARAVTAGLTRDAAVRALTIDAAAIAGNQDRLGTIERGKVANLVVTSGDLFDEHTEVRGVFVHGAPVVRTLTEHSSLSPHPLASIDTRG